jgi:hypothetical protein
LAPRLAPLPAIVKASDEIKSDCPTTVSFTPTARLAEMRQRLQALVDAVNTVSPPAAGAISLNRAFCSSLSEP